MRSSALIPPEVRESWEQHQAEFGLLETQTFEHDLGLLFTLQWMGLQQHFC